MQVCATAADADGVIVSFVPFRVMVHGRTGISFYEYRTSAIVYYLQLDTDMVVMHLAQPGMLLRRVVLCVAAGVGDGVLMSFVDFPAAVVMVIQLLSWQYSTGRDEPHAVILANALANLHCLVTSQERLKHGCGDTR